MVIVKNRRSDIRTPRHPALRSDGSAPHGGQRPTEFQREARCVDRNDSRGSSPAGRDTRPLSSPATTRRSSATGATRGRGVTEGGDEHVRGTRVSIRSRSRVANKRAPVKPCSVSISPNILLPVLSTANSMWWTPICRKPGAYTSAFTTS